MLSSSCSEPSSSIDVGGSSKKFLPPDYTPGDNDVLMGRGKKCFQHIGNERFRSIVATKLDAYSASMTKKEKTSILLSIVSQVRMNSPDGGFIKQDPTTKRWFEVGDFMAREKVSQAFRDALHDDYRSSNEFKKKRKKEKASGNNKEEQVAIQRPSKRCRSTPSKTLMKKELELFDLNLSNEFFVDVSCHDNSKGSSSNSILPDSCSLASWFENEGGLLQTLPILPTSSKATELLGEMPSLEDFEKFFEQPDGCFSGEILQKAGEEKSLQANTATHHHKQNSISHPSQNSCVARTA